MLTFMNKYYEGSIYFNYYLDSVAAVLGSTISILIYGTLRIRFSYIASIILTLIGGTLLLCFQQGYLTPTWIKIFVGDDSPHEHESTEDKEYYMGYTIPIIVFITKLGVNCSFQTNYAASFGDNLIFPFYKRATAIGICNLIARSLTIGASLCAEL